MKDNQTAPSLPRRLLLLIAILGMATVAVLAANLWMAVHRHEGYAFHPTAYATAYIPAEAPTIVKLQRAGENVLVLRLSNGESTRWRVKDDGQAAAVQDGPLLKLHVSPGVSSHELLPVDALTRPFRIDTFSDPVGDVAIASADSLFMTSVRYPMKSLVAAITDYDARHVEAARAHIAGLNLDPKEPTELRLRRLWELLRNDLRPRIGAPPRALVRQSPWVQYQRAVAGEVKIYCANLSEILVFFATVAGIPARVVDVAGKQNNVFLGAHAFVEVYLAEERRWMYTDLTMDIYRIRAGAKGPTLNGGELMQFIHARADELLFITRLRDGNLLESPFVQTSPSPASFIHPNALLVYHRDYGEERYSLPARAMRYLLHPEPAYGLGFDRTRSTIKHVMFYGLVVLAPIWALLMLWWLRQRRRPH
jgi:hypothetical protein